MGSWGGSIDVFVNHSVKGRKETMVRYKRIASILLVLISWGRDRSKEIVIRMKLLIDDRIAASYDTR
jgi:hypothetical protein